MIYKAEGLTSKPGRGDLGSTWNFDSLALRVFKSGGFEPQGTAALMQSGASEAGRFPRYLPPCSPWPSTVRVCLSRIVRADFILTVARLALTGQRSVSFGVHDVCVFHGRKEFVCFSLH